MGMEGLRAFVRRNGLVAAGARRFAGLVMRDQLTVEVALTLHHRLGQPEAELSVRPANPVIGLMVCARSTWLGSDARDPLTATGDAAFDSELALLVPDPTVLGLFEAPARALMREALSTGTAVLEDGAFSATLAPDLFDDEALEAICNRLLDLAFTLSAPPRTWLERTLTLASRDLDPRVRKQLVAHLEQVPRLRAELELHRMNTGTGGPEAADVETLLAVLSSTTLEPPSRAAALPKLLADLSVADVVAASRNVSELWGPLSRYGEGEAFDTLMLELERTLTPDRMAEEPDAVLELLEHLWPFAKRSRHHTAMAFSRLIRNLGHRGALDMVSLLLETKDQTRFFAALDALIALTLPHPDVHEELAHRLGEKGLSRLHSWLSDYLAKRPRSPADLTLITVALDHLPMLEDHTAEALSLLELLEEYVGPPAEPRLIELLGNERDILVNRAIVLLGELGGRESQLALEPLTSGFFRPSETKRLARASLARLHERLGALETGGLSLSDDSLGGDGGLSLSDD